MRSAALTSFFLSVPIHLLIIILILAINDILPPLLVLKIPFNGLFNAVRKLRLRQPAQLIMNLRRIDCVTHIMTFAVGYVRNQALRLA